jgi:hypothetical protein
LRSGSPLGPRSLAAVVILGLLAGCAPRAGLRFPAGPGTPAGDVSAELLEAESTCSGVQAMTAEIGLSGRVAGQRVRGRLHAGIDDRGRLRLEAIAPFGAPAFVLAADEQLATLLLPRDGRVVEREPTADLLEALAGLRLGGRDLHALLTGCVSPTRVPSIAERYANGWLSVTFEDGAQAWLAPSAGSWRFLAGRVGDVRVEYNEVTAGLPRRIHLRTHAGDGGRDRVEVTLALAQLETNASLPAAAFLVDVPPGARPMSMDELRRRGLLARRSP